MSEERQPAHREETLSRLRRILQALAMSGEQQKVLFPEFVVLGDELGREFDCWYHVLVGHGHERTLPPQALAFLSEIDGVFDRMVDAHEHVWSADRVDQGGEWATVRHLAGQALESLGWPQEDPGPFKEDNVRE